MCESKCGDINSVFNMRSNQPLKTPDYREVFTMSCITLVTVKLHLYAAGQQ